MSWNNAQLETLILVKSVVIHFGNYLINLCKGSIPSKVSYPLASMTQKGFSCTEDNNELANATSLGRSVAMLYNTHDGKCWTSYFTSLWSLTAVCTVLCALSDTIP
jgi:hypothetical protein